MTPGIVLFVLMLQWPDKPPQRYVSEEVTAEECSQLVLETMKMNNEQLVGAKLYGQCVTIVPKTFEIKEETE